MFAPASIDIRSLANVYLSVFRVGDFVDKVGHTSYISTVINPLTGHEFKSKPYFQADDSDKAAPKMDFGTPAVSTAVTPAIK